MATAQSVIHKAVEYINGSEIKGLRHVVLHDFEFKSCWFPAYIDRGSVKCTIAVHIMFPRSEPPYAKVDLEVPAVFLSGDEIRQFRDLVGEAGSLCALLKNMLNAEPITLE
jgi:hypothetical protein